VQNGPIGDIARERVLGGDGDRLADELEVTRIDSLSAIA
jgi:hypothetical protein